MCCSDFYVFAELHKFSLPNVISLAILSSAIPDVEKQLSKPLNLQHAFLTFVWVSHKLDFFFPATQDFVMKFSHLNKAV